MHDILNVFEHQLFRLHRPDGSRVKKSFREILTEPDDAYALDYPREYYNVAALNLMAYLAQVVFEPETTAELVERLKRPLTETEFEAAIKPFRSHFALTGDGPRFMQGKPLENDKSAESLSIAIFTTSQHDRRFLNREDPDWAVRPEQAGLLLFTRNTFYEGTAGRGYQKGTNGDTPVRTLVTLPAEGDTIRLRQSIWLNVLTRERQRGYPGDYAEDGTGYDGFFWESPPEGDVPSGGITLRAGLGWMTAFHWLHFEETDETFTCPVTGEPVSGYVARKLTKKSTGIAYGDKGDQEAGVRAERLFRHPNVPTRKSLNNKTGNYENEQPYLVDRLKGMVDALGSTFFGSRVKADRSRILAPVVAQLFARELLDLELNVRLLVFGFHMLSGQKNVHGGYELDTFAYKLPGHSEEETSYLMSVGQEIMDGGAAFAEGVARILQRAIQTTSGAGVRAKENEEGRIVLEKTEPVKSSDYAFGRDVLAEYWRAVQSELHSFVEEIGKAASDGPGALNEARYDLQERWETALIKVAWRLYLPVFDHYSTLPRTMPYAHAARRIFSVSLNKSRTVQQEPQNT